MNTLNTIPANLLVARRNSEFSAVFQMLCARGSQVLQSKSINVEDAANELISMLCDVHEDELDEELGEDEEGEEAEKEKEGSYI